MKYLIILVDKDGKDILGSDGALRIDGRWSLDRTRQAVRERNSQFCKNFPHKIAAGFYFWRRGNYSQSLKNIYWL